MIRINHPSPPIQAQRSKAFAKKPLDDKLSDLGMRLRHIDFTARLRVGGRAVVHLGQRLDGMPFPLSDLVRVKLVLRRQPRNRSLAALAYHLEVSPEEYYPTREVRMRQKGPATS